MGYVTAPVQTAGAKSGMGAREGAVRGRDREDERGQYRQETAAGEVRRGGADFLIKRAGHLSCLVSSPSLTLGYVLLALPTPSCGEGLLL